MGTQKVYKQYHLPQISPWGLRTAQLHQVGGEKV